MSAGSRRLRQALWRDSGRPFSVFRVTRAKRKRVCRGFLSGQRSGSVPIRRLAGLVAVRVIGVPTAAADSIMRRSRVARQRYLLSGAKGKAPRTRPHRSASEGLVARLALGSTTATWGDDHRGGLKGSKEKPSRAGAREGGVVTSQLTLAGIG